MTSVKHAGQQKWMLFVILVVLLVAVGFSVFLDHNRSLENKHDIRELACILVSQTPDDPAKPLIHDFRAKYHCPPFNPAAVGRLTPPRSTVTRTVPTPGPTKTRTVPSPVLSTVVISGHTITEEPVTRTVTRYRTVTRTRTVYPPPCVKSIHLPCTLAAK